MTIITTILIYCFFLVWLCFGIVFVIDVFQDLIYNRKREKREQKQAARDLEYHEMRMKELK